jgi:hypothetical protein
MRELGGLPARPEREGGRVTAAKADDAGADDSVVSVEAELSSAIDRSDDSR